MRKVIRTVQEKELEKKNPLLVPNAVYISKKTFNKGGNK